MDNWRFGHDQVVLPESHVITYSVLIEVILWCCRCFWHFLWCVFKASTTASPSLQIKDLKAWCAQSNKLTSLQTCEAKNSLADAVKHLNSGEELKQTSPISAKGTQKWLLVQSWWAIFWGCWKCVWSNSERNFLIWTYFFSACIPHLISLRRCWACIWVWGGHILTCILYL